MFKNLLLTLAEPGSEGGSGGGGTPTESGPPPLPSASARERIYEHADASPNSGTDGTEAPPAAPEATPKPPAGLPSAGLPSAGLPSAGLPSAGLSSAGLSSAGLSSAGLPSAGLPSAGPDSAKAKDSDSAPAKGEGTLDPVAEKRVKDAQAAFTKGQQDLAAERKARKEAEAKIAKVSKYVDMEKLDAHDAEELDKELDQPVTKRDLEALKAASPPTEDAPSASTLDSETRQKFLDDYYTKNAHVKPYADSGEAYGVFLKAAERLGPEIAGLSELDQLAKIGEAVSSYFRTKDAEREKAIAERLNTKRSNISVGGGLDSAGAPGTGEAEDVGDDPAAEVAHRKAAQSRALRPTL